MSRRRAAPPPRTLWSQTVAPDPRMLRYTVGDDRAWDAHLLRWDVLGSLGHVAGLHASGLLSGPAHLRLRRGLRAALRAVEAGDLGIDRVHEDVHSAVEDWLTRRDRTAGERLHTGRSRNDQVAVDLRLFLKHTLLEIHGSALDLAQALLRFASAHRRVLWPGYTHQRRAMPSSVGLWAAAYADGLLDGIEGLPSLWRRVDRSPLGSAAGYGVPLPLDREAAARALGFAGLDHTVASVQLGRGKLEAAVLFWCSQLGHEVARLSTDVILYSAEEFGFLVLPRDFSTGSSIMPHKRNPDLFELTRAHAAALEGDLVTILQLKAKLGSGYHRDFQLLKEPLIRGLARADGMLDILALTVPRLALDRKRCRAALTGGVLATDAVMRRTEAGVPFRSAYRAVAEGLARGEIEAEPTVAAMLERRRSTGALGNLGLGALRDRWRACRRWQQTERTRFERAMARLAGTRRRGP